MSAAYVLMLVVSAYALRFGIGEVLKADLGVDAS